MSINNLFVANNNITTSITRGLPGTAELTALSNQYARHIIEAMDANAAEYTERIQDSTVDAATLDRLIIELIPEDYEEHAKFLVDLSDANIDSLLKSQQSKRSRSKSKPMTLANYHTLMSAAVAEFLIRKITNREKSAGFGVSRAGVVDYTIEQLEQLSADQDRLRREIRNIQSKKSLMKAKPDFDENDERWIALLRAEQQLKDLRVSSDTRVVEVDKTKDDLQAMFEGVDIGKLKSADAHELLARIAELTRGM